MTSTTCMYDKIYSHVIVFYISFTPNVGGGAAKLGIAESQLSLSTGVDGAKSAFWVSKCLAQENFNLVDALVAVAEIWYHL